MALSQLQCLDDNHVNQRTTESKPEFLYCEDQRLALELFLRDGREAFVKYLGARGLRGFLSDLELDTLAEAVEPYDPGSEIFPQDAEDDEPALSMHYWPELSDKSIPQMDLGWPDCASYRGVTRTSVYTQPPLEDQAHIKEVVRKMIAQAQKVIAVVMDVFTDVDIFRDLLDAGFKRKVSVYILLESSTLPHFRSMCQRANMHAGHLKNLRVRCTDGAEIYTRSCTKVRGRMGHRFMFIDGDKAVSGSYSFTWTSSRLDRNLITVVTGQAVEAFDRLFRVLYATSSSVDLRKVATEPEPELEPLPQPAAVAPPSADMVRKLYSAKYALVALGNPNTTPPAGPIETQNPENSKNQKTNKHKGKGASKEAIQEAPPIHPGLMNLEKACMISYLPTWPEPDPASDVIGFINIRDNRKPNQVHLQRSEMYETSQAIRFSSPISMPKETLPEVAMPRELTAKHEEVNKLQPAEDKTKAGESVAGVGQPTQLNAGPGGIESKAEEPGEQSPASVTKCESDKGPTKTLNTENKRHSDTPTNQDAAHNSTPHLSAHTPPQSSSEASTPITEGPLHTTQTVTTLPGSNTKNKEAETNSDTKRTQTMLPHVDVHTQAVHTQPQNSSDIQTPTNNSHASSSSTSDTSSQSVKPTTLSENSQVSISTTPVACSSLSSVSASSIPPLTPSSTTLNPPLPSSSASPSLTSTPPIPKPRTVQLVIKGNVTDNDQKLPEFSVVPKAVTTTVRLVVHNEPIVETLVQTSAEKVPETVPELHNNSEGVTGAQENAKDTLNTGEAPQQEENGTSQETKNEETVGGDERAGMSDVLITDAPKAENANVQEIIPEDVEPKSLTVIDVKLTPQVDGVATVQTEIKAPPERVSTEVPEVPNEKCENGTEPKTYLANAQVPQIISYSDLLPQEKDVLETVDPLKAPTHTTVSTHNTTQEQSLKARGGTHTPEKPLRLHLSEIHTPDMLSPTPERESRSLAALTLTPTPDGFRPRTPTPDSRTHTPDPRSCTPDFRTPTPDGYLSPRTDSTLSNTSEEYYECSDSPFHEPVIERAASRNHGTTEDHVSFTHTNNANATSPVYINSRTATSGATDRNTSIGERQSLSEPARVWPSSSLLEKKVKMGVESANEEKGREEEEKGRKLSEEAKRKANHFKDCKDTEDKNKEGQPQAPKRKKVLNQSAAERPGDGGGTPGEITNERTEPKQSPAVDLQPMKGSPEVKRQDKAVAALRPSGVERIDRPQTTDGQKLLQTSPSSPRGQQQNSEASSSFQPPRPSRPLSPNWALGPRPREGRQLNQAESTAFYDNTSSPRRPPSRPPPPVKVGAVGTATGQKQAEVSLSQQGFLSRQPLAAQGRTRAGQTQNQHPYAKPSFPLTQSNREAQLHAQSQNQTVSPREAHWQEQGRAPFSFTFSRLYSLKGLKDKMSKLPAQSKRGSASSPGQGHKSTS